MTDAAAGNVWVTLVSGLFALAGLAGGMFAVFRDRWSRERLSTLEGNVLAYKDRVRLLEEDAATDKVDRAKMQSELDAAGQKIQVLTDLKTAKEELDRLSETIEEHHVVVVGEFDVGMRKLAQIHGLIVELVTADRSAR